MLVSKNKMLQQNILAVIYIRPKTFICIIATKNTLRWHLDSVPALVSNVSLWVVRKVKRNVGRKPEMWMHLKLLSLITTFVLSFGSNNQGKGAKNCYLPPKTRQKQMWVVVCRSSSSGEVVWKSQMTVANVDSHTATRSYHLILTKSLRVPVNDCVPAGWNTNTPFARPNTGETALALPSHIASAASWE